MREGGDLKQAGHSRATRCFSASATAWCRSCGRSRANATGADTLLSGSWDFTIKLWSPRAVRSLATFAEHQHSVYSAIWSPSNPEQFASASGDHTLKIWDINEPHSVQTILAHEGEVLSCDWNKYNDFIVVSGAVDRTIRVWVRASSRTRTHTQPETARTHAPI